MRECFFFHIYLSLRFHASCEMPTKEHVMTCGKKTIHQLTKCNSKWKQQTLNDLAAVLQADKEQSQLRPTETKKTSMEETPFVTVGCLFASYSSYFVSSSFSTATRSQPSRLRKRNLLRRMRQIDGRQSKVETHTLNLYPFIIHAKSVYMILLIFKRMKSGRKTRTKFLNNQVKSICVDHLESCKNASNGSPHLRTASACIERHVFHLLVWKRIAQKKVINRHSAYVNMMNANIKCIRNK